MKKNKETLPKAMKYEDAMKRLEEIVEDMENNDRDMDKSLARFEEGVALVRWCSAKLEETKKKVDVLVQKGGHLVRQPFNDDEKNDE